MDRLTTGDRGVYTFPQAGRLRRRRRRNTGPPFGFIICLIIVNGGLLYLLIQLWYLGLEKIVFRKSQKVAPPFPGHFSRPNATTSTKKSPILVVGLPKAGTSSLFEFFHCLGYYSQHWYCCRKQTTAQRGGPTYMSECMLYNLRFGLPILQGCGDYDVYTELNGPRPSSSSSSSSQLDPQVQKQPRIFLPQHYHLQELHDYAPDATWILNVRNVDDWIDSVMSVDGHMLIRQFIYEVQQHDPFETPKGRKETIAFLRRFWDEHVRQIYDFVQNHPSSSHQLVTVNISDPNAGLHLARSLGLEKESRAIRCWGQHNKREEEERV
jgi:hypothetical protein